jgi:hypothetical protein
MCCEEAFLEALKVDIGAFRDYRAAIASTQP